VSDEPKPEDAPPAEAVPESPIPKDMESMLPSDVPKISLPIFEGPLDLVLYLIRREKVDIHDIPIAPITREYMAYLDVMKELNLELAGEFLVMAATLIHIKSKMLVPIEPTEAQADEDMVDPREELVQRLLEFQKYKDAAGLLHQKREIRAATFIRPDSVIPKFVDTGEEMLEAGLFDLISAFKELLERRKVLIQHEVESEGKTVEDRIEEILKMMKEGASLEFTDLFEDQRTKMDMIVTFLAVLELIRLKRVKVYQKGNFGTIRIFRPIGPEAGAPNPTV
jgi:segregation and condensation protein A